MICGLVYSLLAKCPNQVGIPRGNKISMVWFHWCQCLSIHFYVLFWNINWIQSNLIPYFTCPYKIFCKYIYLVFNLLGSWPVIKVVPIILKESTLKIGYILNYVFCSSKYSTWRFESDWAYLGWTFAISFVISSTRFWIVSFICRWFLMHLLEV